MGPTRRALFHPRVIHPKRPWIVFPSKRPPASLCLVVLLLSPSLQINCIGHASAPTIAAPYLTRLGLAPLCKTPPKVHSNSQPSVAVKRVLQKRRGCEYKGAGIVARSIEFNSIARSKETNACSERPDQTVSEYYLALPLPFPYLVSQRESRRELGGR